MDGIVRKVFLILGVLVLVFLLWQQVFMKDDGIMVTTYNALADSVNKAWGSANGGETDSIMPKWNTTYSVMITEPSNMFEIYN